MASAPVLPKFPRDSSGWEYIVIWQRVGAADRFRHDVVAGSREEAATYSHAHVRKAIGENIDCWRIESVRRARVTEE